MLNGFAVVFFAHMYGLGTNLPVHTQDVGREPLWADHGIHITSPEWHRTTIDHTITTRWASTRNKRGFFVGSTKYEVNLKVRVNNTLSLSVGHMSWHNADVAVEMKQANRIGMEVKL